MSRFISAVIVAAGRSTRMGRPKLLIPLCGTPVLTHTLKAFDRSCVDEIIVVASEDTVPLFEKEAALLTTPCRFVTGGETRQESVANGVAAVDKRCELIAVADGARPLVTPEDIDRVIAVAEETGAAALGVRVKDTIKVADTANVITATPDRSSLWQVQTPQVFSAPLYREAMAAATADGKDFTDDCQLAEYIGAEVTLVEGSYENIKITTPDDITAATAIIQKRKGVVAMRIGHGYDVHRLTEDRKLILGGVDIPHDKGLLGHSDADVLTHAIMDALCGAAVLGDIGGLFPDTDEKYKGADSVKLLCEVVRLVNERGYRILNIDATVLAQRPKLKPYIPHMRDILAAACGIPTEDINIKATTEEGLGFTGAMEGIAAHAVCLIG